MVAMHIGGSSAFGCERRAIKNSARVDGTGFDGIDRPERGVEENREEVRT
ncbi:hypothetical protein SCNU_16269 [Gordonia neofelifaecis NRRL B-59395]|uniref:Uncharacterized protein n=1 Tax=Gordonia neofelifaecis NRRL B-59395 TaxID=644548 RepID=F1YMV8_9ACTN|nr:hypothetical protein SCNU_16269 [Gordonia neofelifaecis NRRL B-59395]